MKYFSLHNAKEIHLAPGKKIIPAEEFSELQSAAEIVELARVDAERFKEQTALDAEKIKETQAQTF